MHEALIHLAAATLAEQQLQLLAAQRTAELLWALAAEGKGRDAGKQGPR